MIQRTKGSSCLSEIGYVSINLPDSTITMYDSMNEIVVYQETGIKGVGVNFKNEETSFYFEVDILDDTRPKDLTKFLFPGEYSFLNKNLETPQYSKGVELSLKSRDEDNWYVINASSQSQSFIVFGVSGQALLVRVCGSFDVLFDDTRTGKLVPATGEFEFDVALL